MTIEFDNIAEKIKDNTVIDEELILKLIQPNHDVLNETNTDGNTLLHISIVNDRKECALKLIALMQDDGIIEKAKLDGSTALHLAVVHNNLIIARALVNRHIELSVIEDNTYKKPLDLAFQYNSSEKMKKLLETSLAAQNNQQSQRILAEDTTNNSGNNMQNDSEEKSAEIVKLYEKIEKVTNEQQVMQCRLQELFQFFDKCKIFNKNPMLKQQLKDSAGEIIDISFKLMSSIGYFTTEDNIQYLKQESSLLALYCGNINLVESLLNKLLNAGTDKIDEETSVSDVLTNISSLKEISIIEQFIKSLKTSSKQNFTDNSKINKDITSDLSNMSEQEIIINSNSSIEDNDVAGNLPDRDENAFRNAFNVKYKFTNDDINRIGRQLINSEPDSNIIFKELKTTESGTIRGDLQATLDSDIETQLNNNQKIVGIYNTGSNHWISYVIFRNEDKVHVCYKDSLNGEYPDFVQDMSAIFSDTNIKKIGHSKEQMYNFEHHLSGSEYEHVNCGIFALRNMEILAKANINDLLDDSSNIEFFIGGNGEQEYRINLAQERVKLADEYLKDFREQYQLTDQNLRIKVIELLDSEWLKDNSDELISPSQYLTNTATAQKVELNRILGNELYLEYGCAGFSDIKIFMILDNLHKLKLNYGARGAKKAIEITLGTQIHNIKNETRTGKKSLSTDYDDQNNQKFKDDIDKLINIKILCDLLLNTILDPNLYIKAYLGCLELIGQLIYDISWKEDNPSCIRNKHGYRNRHKNEGNKKNKKGAKLDFETLAHLKDLAIDRSFQRFLISDLNLIKDSLSILQDKIHFILIEEQSRCTQKQQQQIQNINQSELIQKSHDQDEGFLKKASAYYHDRKCVDKLIELLELTNEPIYQSLNLDNKIDKYWLGYFFAQVGELAKEVSDCIKYETDLKFPEKNLVRFLFSKLGKYRQEIKDHPHIVYDVNNNKLLQMKLKFKQALPKLSEFLSILKDLLLNFTNTDQVHISYNEVSFQEQMYFEYIYNNGGMFDLFDQNIINYNKQINNFNWKESPKKEELDEIIKEITKYFDQGVTNYDKKINNLVKIIERNTDSLNEAKLKKEEIEKKLSLPNNLLNQQPKTSLLNRKYIEDFRILLNEMVQDGFDLNLLVKNLEDNFENKIENLKSNNVEIEKKLNQNKIFIEEFFQVARTELKSAKSELNKDINEEKLLYSTLKNLDKLFEKAAKNIKNIKIDVKRLEKLNSLNFDNKYSDILKDINIITINNQKISKLSQLKKRYPSIIKSLKISGLAEDVENFNIQTFLKFLKDNGEEIFDTKEIEKKIQNLENTITINNKELDKLKLEYKEIQNCTDFVEDKPNPNQEHFSKNISSSKLFSKLKKVNYEIEFLNEIEKLALDDYPLNMCMGFIGQYCKEILNDNSNEGIKLKNYTSILLNNCINKVIYARSKLILHNATENSIDKVHKISLEHLRPCINDFKALTTVMDQTISNLIEIAMAFMRLSKYNIALSVIQECYDKINKGESLEQIMFDHTDPTQAELSKIYEKFSNISSLSKTQFNQAKEKAIYIKDEQTLLYIELECYINQSNFSYALTIADKLIESLNITRNIILDNPLRITGVLDYLNKKLISSKLQKVFVLQNLQREKEAHKVLLELKNEFDNNKFDKVKYSHLLINIYHGLIFYEPKNSNRYFNEIDNLYNNDNTRQFVNLLRKFEVLFEGKDGNAAEVALKNLVTYFHNNKKLFKELLGDKFFNFKMIVKICELNAIKLDKNILTYMPDQQKVFALIKQKEIDIFKQIDKLFPKVQSLHLKNMYLERKISCKAYNNEVEDFKKVVNQYLQTNSFFIRLVNIKEEISKCLKNLETSSNFKNYEQFNGYVTEIFSLHLQEIKTLDRKIKSQADTLNKDGIEYCKNQKYDLAIDKFNLSLKQIDTLSETVYDKNSLKAYIIYSRARAYNKKGNLINAVTDYREAIGLGYKNNKIHKYLEDCLEEIQRLNNPDGSGMEDYFDASPWMKYTKQGIKKLLKLKLQATGNEKIKAVISSYIWNELEYTAEKLTNEIFMNLEDKTLVVLNLFGKHWVGMVIEKTSDSMNINYMDSAQSPAPVLLREQLVKQIAVSYPDYSIEFTEAALEPQQYNNCGSEVIENLTAYLVGEERTVSQEDAVVIHSLLLEDSLMTDDSIL